MLWNSMKVSQKQVKVNMRKFKSKLKSNSKSIWLGLN